MKLIANIIISIMIVALMLTASCASSKSEITISREGDTLALIEVKNPQQLLLLPIQEDAPEAQMRLNSGKATDTWMDVRLAVSRIDYFVPFAVADSGSNEATAKVEVKGMPAADAVCWTNIKSADTFDTTNTDRYRPVYHHTPSYGWMNDANGLVYKDGEWHLYFQYNPYASVWGNMHWGHSLSTDLVHWTGLKPAIERDTLGHIFSGSAVVDKDNTAGFGNGAIIAYYTSHLEDGSRPRELTEMQCMAYSTDNGRTFTKYSGNPVLNSYQGLENDPNRSRGLRDFRDPKVFWYEPLKMWYMIVSSDKEMRFYTSADLKSWSYVSSFGEGYGVQPNQYECPDFFPLQLDGKEYWVMIVNVNPGCLFGGSATEYFVGTFDGKEFKCINEPEKYKFIDWGKDHYATVTYSNAPGGRVIGMPWMSNWQYANYVPTQQFRSANAVPREFTLFEAEGDIYMAATPVAELSALVSETRKEAKFGIGNQAPKRIDNIDSDNDGAFQLQFDITPARGTSKVNFDLVNAMGEVVKCYLDLEKQRIVMDRSEAGLTDLNRHGQPYNVHEREADEHRKVYSVNYKNDWALGTWAPLNLCEGTSYNIDIYVDKCSVEIFVDGGRIAMTNLVFPSEPLNAVQFSANGDTEVSGMVINQLAK